MQRNYSQGPVLYSIAKTWNEACKINSVTQIYQHEHSAEQWRTQNEHLKQKIKQIETEMILKNKISQAILPIVSDPIEPPIIEGTSAASETDLLFEDLPEKSVHSESSAYSDFEFQNRYYDDDTKKFCRRCKQRGHANVNCVLKSVSCYFCMGNHTRAMCDQNMICFTCGGSNHSRINCEVRVRQKCNRCFKMHADGQKCRMLIFQDDLLVRDLRRDQDIAVCIICNRLGHFNCSKKVEQPRLFGNDVSLRIEKIKNEKHDKILELILISNEEPDVLSRIEKHDLEHELLRKRSTPNIKQKAEKTDSNDSVEIEEIFKRGKPHTKSNHQNKREESTGNQISRDAPPYKKTKQSRNESNGRESQQHQTRNQQRDFYQKDKRRNF